MKREINSWGKRDKAIKYPLILIAWILAVGIGTYFIITYAPLFILFIYLGIYLLLVYFQARFYCIGCPYKGKFCPGVLNMRIANSLSVSVFKNKNFIEKRCLQLEPLVSILTAVHIVLPLIFMWQKWLIFASYSFLFIIHFLLEFKLMCPKCSFNDICPGGKMAVMIFGRRTGQKCQN